MCQTVPKKRLPDHEKDEYISISTRRGILLCKSSFIPGKRDTGLRRLSQERSKEGSIANIRETIERLFFIAEK